MVKVTPTGGRRMSAPDPFTDPHALDWPQFDLTMMEQHGGSWVAAIVRTRTYLGKGETPDVAWTEGRAAAARLGLSPAEIEVFAVCRPEDAWF
jgi:hypothetical protein